MYRHFRHKHPEHVSKRRQKKPALTDSAAKQIDDVLESVVGDQSAAVSPAAHRDNTVSSKKHSPTMVPTQINYFAVEERYSPSEVEDDAMNDTTADIDVEFDEDEGRFKEGDGHDEREDYGTAWSKKNLQNGKKNQFGFPNQNYVLKCERRHSVHPSYQKKRE